MSLFLLVAGETSWPLLWLGDLNPFKWFCLYFFRNILYVYICLYKTHTYIIVHCYICILLVHIHYYICINIKFIHQILKGKREWILYSLGSTKGGRKSIRARKLEVSCKAAYPRNGCKTKTRTMAIFVFLECNRLAPGYKDTHGWQWPTLTVTIPEKKSRYLFPSESKSHSMCPWWSIRGFWKYAVSTGEMCCLWISRARL